jgi:ubiquinone/menaquinone biosynthesis C-methylase UbiE
VQATRTHLQVLRSQLALEGATVVDVGCGAGELTRRLAQAGAQVTGVDPSPEAIARAGAAAGARERYLIGAAQSLPVPDQRADVVTFLNSLHHVPVTSLAQALGEAGRVLRPRGLVYVQEPLAYGCYFELVRLVEDETEVREAAQRALAQAEVVGLRQVAELEYDAVVRHRDFHSFRRAVLLANPARADAFAARAAELEERFLSNGRHDERGWWFVQPTRVTLLARPETG